MEFINQIIGVPLGWIFRLCMNLVGSYGLAIIVFTLITKVILLPLSLWVQKNSIKMIRLKPQLNEIEAQYISDKDRVSELTLELYRAEKYQPLAGIVPMLIQIPIILGLIQVIYHPMQHLLQLPKPLIDAFLQQAESILQTTDLGSGAQITVMDLVKDPAYTGLFASLSVDGADVAGAIQSIQSLDCQFWGWDLAKTPNMLVFNWLACVPLLSGASAFLLSVAQNAANVLQKEAGFFGRWGMAIFLTLFSAYFAALVPAGVGLYWIFGNLFAILVLFLVNAIYPPKKYIDYAALEESKKHLAESKRLQNAGKPTREDKARAKADYKRFVDGTEQKQLVFYSESSGFYKYFHRIIDAILRSSDVKIHYVTSDPKDAVFQLNEPNLIPYYIDNNRLITLFMLVDADIMVMTMPDLQLFHLKRSYVRKDMEYIYLFHGIMTSLSTLRDHALDAYDTLFFGESNMRAEFEAYAKRVSLPEKTLVNVGDGVTEDMHDKVLELRAAEAPHTKRRILIAPSWQADNILESCLGTVVRVLCDGSNEIIIRPHPQYIRRFGARLEEIKEQISAYLSDDCRFEMDFSSNETVYTADILMTDWSGIAFEYAFSTERPVLFIHTPMKVVGENALESDEHRPDILLRNVIGCDLMPETLSETLAPAVERFTTEAASYHDAICAARDQYVYNFGRSGEIGAKYILDRLAAYEAERQRLEAEITV